MIVLAIETTERKIGISFVFRLHFVGIMPDGCHKIVDVHLGDLIGVVGDLKFFCFWIPRCLFDPFGIQRRFDALLAHHAVAVNIDGCLNIFRLCERDIRDEYDKEEYY